MIGTNDLGYPDFEEFRKNYTKCLAELRKLMPNAIFYVSAVPYVEEAKVQTGDYVNNTNIDTVNQIILEICSANGYYYLNPNEVLSQRKRCTCRRCYQRRYPYVSGILCKMAGLSAHALCDS